MFTGYHIVRKFDGGLIWRIINSSNLYWLIFLLALSLKDLPDFCITMKSAVYKAPLVCPVVNQKNSILLQLLHIQYYHALCWRNIHAADRPMDNYLDSQCTQLFFSLSLQHNDLLICFLFGITVFSYERSSFWHIIIRLAPCTELYFKYIHCHHLWLHENKQ